MFTAARAYTGANVACSDADALHTYAAAYAALPVEAKTPNVACHFAPCMMCCGRELSRRALGFLS